MNALTRFVRSFRNHPSIDSSFESYYGSIARNATVGGPSATEARRDFQAIRDSIERIAVY